MSMTPIVATPPGAPEIPPQPLSFLLTLAAMNSVLTSGTMSSGFTAAMWAAWIAGSPNEVRADPVLIKQILSAALVGGGMTEGISVGDRQLRAVGVADSLFRAAPLGAAALAAQIVAACVAEG